MISNILHSRLGRLLLGVATALACVTPASGVSTVSGDYKSMTVSGGNLVALDSQSDLSISADQGATFAVVETTPELDTLKDVNALGATVIAVGIDGLILRSADNGSTWASATAPPLLGSLNGTAGRTDGANPNKWIAVGANGLDGAIYRSADDGSNWTLVNTGSTLDDLLLKDAIRTGNRWLVCGRDQFFEEGVVYSSTDGLNWSASALPVDALPLLALASDGAGNALAVGEQGEILRSTDDGLTFTRIGSGVFSGDINAAVVDSSGTFFLGGDEKAILEVSGSTVSFAVPPAANADPILDLILINDVAAAVGAFDGVAIRTIPFTLTIAAGGSSDLRLTVSQTLVGKTYFVETTIDLLADDWAPVSGTSTLGNGASTFFDFSISGPQRFWRVIEF